MLEPKFVNFSKIEFLKSASHIDQCPPDMGIEIAFVGRSNSGKSSAINAIFARNSLARTSKTPGRTQLINFFELDPQRRIVDLPGYGYAKVPEKIQRQIEQMLSGYLSQRQCLQGLMLLMDIRHPLTRRDMTLIHFVCDLELPIHILLTKCDKMKRGQSNSSLLQVRKTLENYPKISVQTFSALKRIGIEETQQVLDSWYDFDDD